MRIHCPPPGRSAEIIKFRDLRLSTLEIATNVACSYVAEVVLVFRMKHKVAAVIAVLLFVGLLTELNGTSECPNVPLEHENNTSTTVIANKRLTVVSLNMAKEARLDRILKDVRRATFFESADVYLLQEARPGV